MLISIIMPALNEENRIVKALKSIRSQSVNQNEIEILVIDGGSKDKTKEIAAEYGVVILDNPKVVMEEAKKIGLANCKGRYFIFMDADEEFTHDDQLKNRLQFLEENPEVKAIVLNGYITPENCPGLTRYVNSYGDPFSYFVYRSDAENMLHCSSKKYSYKKTEQGKIFYVNENDIIPIGDGGTTMLDLEYYLYHFCDKHDDPERIVTIFSDVVSKTGCFGVLEDDKINHYTSARLRTHLNKLKFRIIVNLSPQEHIPGFVARTKYSKKMIFRQYLFLLYCLFPLAVLLDTIAMVIRKRSLTFFVHFIFVYYVFFYIVYYKFLLIIGKNSGELNYGK